MKRIKLTHGSARVSENITDETKEALNKMTELAFKHQTKQCDIHDVVVPKGTLCECSWPLIRSGTKEKPEYCGNCGKDI